MRRWCSKKRTSRQKARLPPQSAARAHNVRGPTPYLKREPHELDRGGSIDMFVADNKSQRVGGSGGRRGCGRRVLFPRWRFRLFVVNVERAHDKKLSLGGRDLIQDFSQGVGRSGEGKIDVYALNDARRTVV